MQIRTLVVTLFALAVLLSGCASADPRNGGNDPRNGSLRSNEGYYGVVDSISPVASGSQGNAVAGTIIGGVVGGVVGHQIGSGRGNDVATVAGAVGGAVVGHEISKSNGRQDRYAIRVRFDDRSYQTVTQDGLDGLRVGDSVRIEHDRVRRY